MSVAILAPERAQIPSTITPYPYSSFYKLQKLLRNECGLSAIESVEMARAIIEDELEAERAAEASASAPEHDHWGDTLPTLGEPTEAELLPDPEGPALALKRGEKAARKSRKKQVQPPDYGGAFPTAETYLQRKRFWPDPLEDTPRTREKRAEKSGLLPALEALDALAPHGLEWGKLVLPKLEGQPLYSKVTLKHAQRAVVRHLRSVGETACDWKLERGRGGGFHVELVVPTGSGGGLKGLQPVTDLHGLARYLSKPADARACTPDKKALRIWTAEDLERSKMAACEEWLTRDRGRSGRERLQFWGSIGLGKSKR